MGVAEAIAIAKGGADVYQLAQRLGLVDKVLSLFKTQHRILVLGSTGVGKTNFIRSLTDEMPAAIDRMTRTKFTHDEQFKIQGEFVTFVDTPGDLGYESERRDAIIDALRHGVDGIVNVVCYGYHEGRGSKSDAVDASGRARSDFLEARRLDEIALTTAWSGLLGDGQSASWLLTIVTKADLWWNDREGVVRHYESGAYRSALTSASNINVGVLEYSSVFHRFYGEVNLAGSFDDQDRVRSRHHAIATILAALT